MKNILGEVRSLTHTKHNYETDKRLSRMEVTVNKILIRLGDITRANTTQGLSHSDNRSSRPQNDEGSSKSQHYFHSPRRGGFVSSQREIHRNVRGGSHDHRHRIPNLPIFSLNELSDINFKLKNSDYFTFLVLVFSFFSVFVPSVYK